jgi:hypothetical protein
MKIALIAALALLGDTVRAEDWTTTDGVVHKDVKVIKLETDCVTVLESDGGARIPLSNLSPDVQKKLGYDPAAAKAAADKRAAGDKANAIALQNEMNEAAAQKKADLEATGPQSKQ